MSIRQHPVYEAIRDAGYFGERAVPDAAELDRLGLSGSAREKVAKACRAVADINATGHHQEAWDAADTAARQVIDGLPEAQQDPDYLATPDPLADVTDPRELAARVPRFNGLN